MNKFEATKWMYEQGVGSRVRDMNEDIWELLSGGQVGCNFPDKKDIWFGLPNHLEPFTPVLPKKSNEQLAREAHEFGKSNAIQLVKFVFDMVDEKIREAKK